MDARRAAVPAVDGVRARAPQPDQRDVAASLVRVADSLAAAAEELRRLAQNELAVPRDAGLMDGVDVDRPERLLSVRDVADLVGVQARTVRRWREAGVLPAGISVSGITRWRPEAIAEWIASREGAR